MKCPKCGGNMNLRETYYACNDDKNIGCDFYIDTGTKPEPEQDERIREIFENNIITIRTRLKDILRNNFYDNRFHPTPVNVRIEHLIQDMIEASYTSRNAEIEASYEKGKQFVENAYRSEWEVQEDEIKRLKHQLDGFKSQYNADEKTIKALKTEIESMRDTLKFIYEECDWGDDARIGESCLKQLEKGPK